MATARRLQLHRRVLNNIARRDAGLNLDRTPAGVAINGDQEFGSAGREFDWIGEVDALTANLGDCMRLAAYDERELDRGGVAARAGWRKGGVHG